MDKTWIKLNYADLPNDILTGKYEFAWTDSYDVHEYENQKDIDDRLNILGHAEAAGNVCYRTKMPTPPTHEEIMTKWWKINYGDEWHRVTAFYPRSNEYVICESRMPFDFFLNRESTDIPPKN